MGGVLEVERAISSLGMAVGCSALGAGWSGRRGESVEVERAVVGAEGWLDLAAMKMEGWTLLPLPLVGAATPPRAGTGSGARLSLPLMGQDEEAGLSVERSGDEVVVGAVVEGAVVVVVAGARDEAR